MKGNTLLCALCVVVQNIVLISGAGQECGGVFMGDYGYFQYPLTGQSSFPGEGSCIWLIQAFGVSEIRFTLNELASSDSSTSGANLILYPQTEPVDSTLSAITLNGSAVGTTTRLRGSAVVVIFPRVNDNAKFSFTWDSEIEDVSVTDPVTVTSYVNTAEGYLKWRPRRTQERLIWVVDAEEPGLEFGWETVVDSLGCDSLIPCTCLSFRAFEVNTEGYLVELERNCDLTSNGTISSFSSPVVFMASANTSEFGASGIDLRWAVSSVPVTTTTSPPTETLIYFATNVGLKAMTLDGSEVSTIWNRTGSSSVGGVAYDSTASKIYWESSSDTIYRANPDGTEVEAVLVSIQYKPIFGLAFDWITGNLYGASSNSIGEIFVCSTLGSTLSCATIVSGYRAPAGIAVNSLEGYIYWTRSNGATIMRSGMDGSNTVVLIEGPINFYPTGIAIDYGAGRLYWADGGSSRDRIESSDLQGGDKRTVVQLQKNASPWGVVVLGIDRVYWSSNAQYDIQSCTKAGEDITTLYDGKAYLRHMALGTKEILPTGRQNHCEGSRCSHICVLSPQSFHCLCPNGTKLLPDQRTCVHEQPLLKFKGRGLNVYLYFAQPS